MPTNADVTQVSTETVQAPAQQLAEVTQVSVEVIRPSADVVALANVTQDSVELATDVSLTVANQQVTQQSTEITASGPRMPLLRVLGFTAASIGAVAPLTSLQIPSANCIAAPPSAVAAGNFTPLTYIVSNDFGDRHMVYSARRLRPGFALFPVAPPTEPTPVLITPLIQMTNTGTPPVAAFSTPIAPSGFGDLKVTARLTRFRFDLFGTCEFAQGDVDLNPTGAI